MNAQYTGNKIAELRKEKGLTQKELGFQLHVSDSAVSKWERGLNFPDVELLETIAHVLDTTVFDLLGLENPTEKELAEAFTKIVFWRENKRFVKTKYRLSVSAIYIASFIPMFFSQYGALNGVQEVTGLINLANPIGIL